MSYGKDSCRALTLGLILVAAPVAAGAEGYDERFRELDRQLMLADQAQLDCRDLLERVAKLLRSQISWNSGSMEDALQRVIDAAAGAQEKARITAQANAGFRSTIATMETDISSLREEAQDLRNKLSTADGNRVATEREKQQIQDSWLQKQRTLESTVKELQAKLKDAEESNATTKQAKERVEEIWSQEVQPRKRQVEQLERSLNLSEDKRQELARRNRELEEVNQRLRDALDRLEAEVALWKAKAAEYQSRIVVYAPVAAELNNIERPYVPIGFRPFLHGREVHVFVLVGADGKAHLQEIEKRNGVADWVIARIEECVRRSHWRPARDESNRQVDQIRRVIFRFLW